MSLKTLFKLSLGAYSVHQGFRMLGEATNVLVGGSGLGKMHTVGDPQQPISDERSGGMRRQVYRVKPGDIDERIAILQEKIMKGRQDPMIRKMTVQEVSRRCGERWCVTEGDQWGEVVAVYNMLKRRYRYVHDEVKRDLFQSPRRTLELGGGDCDDAVILLDSCLGSIGYSTGARVVETKQSTGGWDHIYSLVAINGKWAALDMSVPGWPAGREVPKSQLRAIRDYAFR